MNNKTYVYKITRSDGLCYIGITVNCKARFKSHERSERFSIGIKDIEILEECDTYEKAEDLEEYYINKFDTFNNGLNLSINGKGNHLCESFTTKGFKFSEESKKKMSLSAKKRGISLAAVEALKSEEVRKKLSKKRKGISWGNVKLTSEQINQIMYNFKNNLHPFDDEFISKYITKKDRHLIGKVPLEQLTALNGKPIKYHTLYAHFYSNLFGVHKNTILQVISNDGKRCKHHSEV